MSDVEMTAIDADEDIDISDIKGILSGSEEGEINDTDSDDASSVRHRTKEDNALNKINGNKYSFQTDGDNGINHSIFDEDDLAQMGERVNRFGLDTDSDTKILEKEKTDLYESLSIVTQEDIRHARLDTIHVHGTDKMKTNDIFEYFFAHKPSFLEWVSENSCDVVWKDDISAARAMVFYSKEILYECDSAMDGDISMNGKDINAISTDAVSLADIKVPIPPGRWRAGAPHPLADFIFLRFANKSDKKVSGKEKLKVYSKKYRNSIDSENVQGGLISESMKSKINSMKEQVYETEDEKSKNPWGELCETWGINDSQEVFGISNGASIGHPAPLPFYKPSSVRDRIGVMGSSHTHLPITERLSMPFRRNHGNVKMRLGKRAPEIIDVADSTESEEESQSSDEEWTSRRKVPRMRMHADDEQEKMNKKRISSDQPTSPWDDEVSLNTITVEVKNEVIEKPYVQPDNKNKRMDTSNSKHKNTKDLRSRIGRRRKSYESESDDSSSPPPRVASRTKQSAAPTVWSRLDTSRSAEPANSHSDSDSESQNDLRHTISKSITKIISNRPGFNKVDLRSRLGKKSDFRASPLRIEVDNELYAQSDDE